MIYYLYLICFLVAVQHDGQVSSQHSRTLYGLGDGQSQVGMVSWGDGIAGIPCLIPSSWYIILVYIYMIYTNIHPFWKGMENKYLISKYLFITGWNIMLMGFLHWVSRWHLGAKRLRQCGDVMPDLPWEFHKWQHSSKGILYTYR